MHIYMACREETCWLQPARGQEAAEAGSNEREVEAVARGPVAGASAAAGRRRSGGRGRRGVDVAQGLRHVDGRHLVRVRGHRHPRLHVPPHGHLRAPHQAPRLPAPRQRGAPPRAPPPRRLSRRQAPEPSHGGDGAAGGGPVGVDAGATVPDVPGAAGAASAGAVPEGRGALAAARPRRPPLLHAAMIEISRTMLQWNNMLETHAVKPTNRPIDRWIESCC